MNNIFTVNIFDALNDLGKVMEINLSIYLCLTNLKDFLKRLAWAELHLNHDVKCEVVFFVFNKMTKWRIS